MSSNNRSQGIQVFPSHVPPYTKKKKGINKEVGCKLASLIHKKSLHFETKNNEFKLFKYQNLQSGGVGIYELKH
jgi:hypothetical protein